MGIFSQASAWSAFWVLLTGANVAGYMSWLSGVVCAAFRTDDCLFLFRMLAGAFTLCSIATCAKLSHWLFIHACSCFLLRRSSCGVSWLLRLLVEVFPASVSSGRMCSLHKDKFLTCLSLL